MVGQKSRGKAKGPELLFDEKARAEYLTGFRKRKQERKQAGREYLAKKAKEEQLAARKELRQARKEKAAENVREQRKAFGLEAEGESDLDNDDGLNGDDAFDGDEYDAVPQIQEEEYDSDEHRTHVVVEAFDPEQEAFEKATVVASSAPARTRKAETASASASAAISSVETLPPSSRRVNKAKANASLSSLFSPAESIRVELVSSFHDEPNFTSIKLTLSLFPFLSPHSRIAGEGEETDHSHQEKDISQKRLHISGLTSSFSQEDLIRRFSTFGTVVALDGLGKLDGVGQFCPYAYLTLKAEPQQIKRCTNLLSGSVWKGATLRIGEAKPDYQERIRLEREKRKLEEEEKANSAKKRKRLPPGMGVESYRMEPVDQAAVEIGLAWGWKRTPAGHLVRPLRMRPSHPLPKPSRASTLSRANAVAQDDEEEQIKQFKKPARVNSRPPTKAHRITIDPTRYGAIHLSGPLLESLAAETGETSGFLDVALLGAGEWHCEEIDDEEAATEDRTLRLVRWQYVAKDGKVMHEEFTKLPVRIVPKATRFSAATAMADMDGQDVMAQLDFDRFSNAGSEDLFSGFTSSLTPAKPQVEPKKFATSKAATQVKVVDATDIDDLFAGLPKSTGAVTSFNELFSDFASTLTRAPQPKRAQVEKRILTPTACKKGSFVPGLDPEEEDAANFSDGYDEAAVAPPVRDIKQIWNAEEEKEKTLALLGEMFGSESDDEALVTSVVENHVGRLEAEEDVDALSRSNSCSSDSESSSESRSESEAAEQVEMAESSSSFKETLKYSCASGSEQVDDKVVDEVEAEPIFTIDEPTEVQGKKGVMEQESDGAVDRIVEKASDPLDAKSRRSAFLLSLSDSSESKAKNQSANFTPIARFDPGTLATISVPADADATAFCDQASVMPNTVTEPSKTVEASQDAKGTTVSISTLKEMFKPKDRHSTWNVTAGFSVGLGAQDASNGGDSVGGFRLMDSLGLEFELEEEDEKEEKFEPQLSLIPSSYSNKGYARFQPIAQSMQEHESSMQPSKFGHFFPSSNVKSSWNGAKTQTSVQRWLKPRTQEEKENDWSKYKQELTHIIKKRHREAARKNKRNFNSLPNNNNNNNIGS